MNQEFMKTFYRKQYDDPEHFLGYQRKEYMLLVNQIKMIADRIDSPNDDYEKMIGLFHQKAGILMEIAYLQGAEDREDAGIIIVF